MKKPLTDEDLLERASIDGRVTFAVAAFAIAAALVALLDRIGVPEKIVGVLGPILVLAGLSLIGLVLHAMRVSRFYAAGRAVPVPYAALAMMALAAGIAVPFLPPTRAGGAIYGLSLGFSLGLLAAAILTGPFLRKTGAFSLPDLVARRFPHTGVRMGMIAVSSAVAIFIALAGYESVIRGLAFSLGTPRLYAAALAGLVLLLVALPGGMGGVVWAASGAAGILVAGLLLPLGAILLEGEPLPAPVFGDPRAWDIAIAQIASWHGAGDDPYTGTMVVVAIALGVACLAPLLAPAMTARDAPSARRAGISALAWIAALAAIVMVSMSVSALIVQFVLVDSRPDRLPAFAYAASGSGLLSICGKYVASADQALAACEALRGFRGMVLRAQDFQPGGLWLVLGLPELRGSGVALSGLVGAALVAIAMVTAAAGFQAFGTAIGHDGLYRARESTAMTSRRLAMTRVVIALSVIACGALLNRVTIDPRAMIGLAILFSAAAVAPMLALSLWPRAAGRDAAIALLVGLATAGAVIAIEGRKPDVETLAFAAVCACAAAFCAGIATSFLHRSGLASEGSAFVHDLLHGESDILDTDRGA